MSEISLKNGQVITIREAKKEDSMDMIKFYNFVGGETDFLSFGKNEFNRDRLEYEKYIESTKNEANSIILLALACGEIVGIASINSNQKVRSRHIGTFGIVIENKYCGLGLGRKIMEHLIEWAKFNGITKKITLVTRVDNDKAIDLYKKMGFEIEGKLGKDNYVDGIYYDTLLMSLFL